jgi:ribosome-associated translation inhibitor RaiA
MKLPVQVTFRNMAGREPVEAYIRKEVDKLETYYDRIMGCRVIVEVPHRHHEEGNTYHIRIDVTVPGGEIVVKEEASLHAAKQQTGQEKLSKQGDILSSHKHLRVAIHEAFGRARRQLQASLNPANVTAGGRCSTGVVGVHVLGLPSRRGVTKSRPN